jgi:hypothetical protein
MRKTIAKLSMVGPAVLEEPSYRDAKRRAYAYANKHNATVMLFDAATGKLLKTIRPGAPWTQR